MTCSTVRPWLRTTTIMQQGNGLRGVRVPKELTAHHHDTVLSTYRKRTLPLMQRKQAVTGAEKPKRTGTQTSQKRYRPRTERCSHHRSDQHSWKCRLFREQQGQETWKENTALYRSCCTMRNHWDTANRIHTMQTPSNRQLLKYSRITVRRWRKKCQTQRWSIRFETHYRKSCVHGFHGKGNYENREGLCRLVGFNERQTTTLTYGKPWCHEANFIRRNIIGVLRRKSRLQVVKDPADKSKLTHS